jgi:2'-5' RNA ligase
VRGFYAIFLDGQAQEKLQSAVHSVHAIWPSELTAALRWISNAQWHITLQFFPHFPEEKLLLYTEKVARALENFSQFTASISHFAPFPKQKNSDIFSAWIVDSVSLSALHEIINRCAYIVDPALSAQESNHNFKPHITLARGPILATHIPVNLSITVSEICFVESVLDEGQHVYHILKKHSLA